MLNIPENIKELFRADNNRTDTVKHLKLRFYDQDISLLFPADLLFPSDELFPVDMNPFLTIENHRINTESFTLTESICESGDLHFGDCNASKVEITVVDIVEDLIDKEFLLSLEVGGYEMSMGIYRVESFIRQSDRRMRKITAYDRMRNFQRDVAVWYQTLEFPLSLHQFRNSLCDHIGIEQVRSELPLDDMQITKTIDPEQISGLDVLQAICEINGCFGHIDKAGRLIYITLGRSGLYPSETLFPDDNIFPSEMENAEKISYYKPSETTYEDYGVYSIEKLQIRQEEGQVGITYGDGNNGYTIQGNFLVYGKSSSDLTTIAATIFDQITDRLYRPAKIACPAFPWVEPGDGLICYTRDDVIETYCLKRTITGIQAMTDTYEASGSPYREDDFTINTQIIQLEGKTAIVTKKVDEISFDLSDFKKDTNSRFEQTAEQISLKVSKGDVSAQLSVESDKVIIAGNRLIVDSTNFKLDANGNATFSGDVRGADIYGSSIIGSSIETDIFYANDSEVGMGDFYVSTDGSNIFSSRDQSVVFQTQAGGPFGSYAALVLKSRSGTTTLSDHHLETGVVEVSRVMAENDVMIHNGWTKFWSCSEMFDELYASLSDMRFKNSIHYLDDKKALEAILKVSTCTFKYNSPVNPHKKSGDWDIGVIAQDVLGPLKNYPIVIESKDGYYRVNYSGFIPLLISSVKQLHEEICQIREDIR